jgi:hypothetical protein
VAIALDTWNGSVWVTVTVGASPIRGTTGATLAATATASSAGAEGSSGAPNESGNSSRSAPVRAAAAATPRWCAGSSQGSAGPVDPGGPAPAASMARKLVCRRITAANTTRTPAIPAGRADSARGHDHPGRMTGRSTNQERA